MIRFGNYRCHVWSSLRRNVVAETRLCVCHRLSYYTCSVHLVVLVQL